MDHDFVFAVLLLGSIPACMVFWWVFIRLVAGVAWLAGWIK